MKNGENASHFKSYMSLELRVFFLIFREGFKLKIKKRKKKKRIYIIC